MHNELAAIKAQVLFDYFIARILTVQLNYVML